VSNNELMGRRYGERPVGGKRCGAMWRDLRREIIPIPDGRHYRLARPGEV